MTMIRLTPRDTIQYAHTPMQRLIIRSKAQGTVIGLRSEWQYLFTVIHKLKLTLTKVLLIS